MKDVATYADLISWKSALTCLHTCGRSRNLSMPCFPVTDIDHDKKKNLASEQSYLGKHYTPTRSDLYVGGVIIELPEKSIKIM